MNLEAVCFGSLESDLYQQLHQYDPTQHEHIVIQLKFTYFATKITKCCYLEYGYEIVIFLIFNGVFSLRGMIISPPSSLGTTFLNYFGLSLWIASGYWESPNLLL
jgi:hypothetical protein